jgi:hypothetical protein
MSVHFCLIESLDKIQQDIYKNNINDIDLEDAIEDTIN